MTLADAFATHEAIEHARVLHDTWGHLAPQAATRYSGWIVFANGAYGDSGVLIDAAFEGLDDSPWLYDDMIRFIEQHPGEPGNVYRWDGSYTKYKNGGCRFSGRPEPVPLRIDGENRRLRSG